MAKRRSLVYQHLENVSGDVLDEYQDIIRDYVYRRQGVYALYRRGKLYYVGLASNLRNRLKAHLKDRHARRRDRFSLYLTESDHHLRELEALVVRVVRPPGNKQLGKFARSDNLKPRFRRDISRHHRRLLDEMLGQRLGRPRIKITRGRKSKKEESKPDLFGCFSRATTIKGEYKGNEYRARVRKNGTIRYARRVYFSVSEAASDAIGRPANGWWFWKCKAPSGEWVRLRELGR